MTLLFCDPIFARHQTGAHVECPARVQAIASLLEKTGLAARCQMADFTPAILDDLSKTHTPEMIRRVDEVSSCGGGSLDADTIVCPESYLVARAAAGAAMAAVDGVLSGADGTALCLVRPPGHHATSGRSMGFCLFNNIAVAANHARTRHGLKRILIVDFDVHHGNGTQDIFYSDAEVFFLSIHRFGHGFYPGTGRADETGAGPGLGFNRNVPVSFGISRSDYLAAFRNAIAKAADAIKPELVLLSAGFDAHALDPIGSLGLETEDFTELTRAVCEVADSYCFGRVVSCLEGGYDPGALAESVIAHLEVLLR